MCNFSKATEQVSGRGETSTEVLKSHLSILCPVVSNQPNQRLLLGL